MVLSPWPSILFFIASPTRFNDICRLSSIRSTESGNVFLLWTSPSSRLPDDVGRFHPSNPLFLPTRYKPSFLAHIKTYAFRYPNIPKDHTVNVPYYGCSPFSRRGVDRFGPAKVRDASARHRISHLSPPFYYRATTRNGCFTVEARLSSGLAFNRFVPSVSIRVFYVPRKPT